MYIMLLILKNKIYCCVFIKGQSSMYRGDDVEPVLCTDLKEPETAQVIYIYYCTICIYYVN